jgi:hypothetical protein
MEVGSLQMELRRQRLLAAELGDRVEAAELEASAIRAGLEARLKVSSKVGTALYGALIRFSKHLVAISYV